VDILENLSFCVAQKKERHTGLGYSIFFFTYSVLTYIPQWFNVFPVITLSAYLMVFEHSGEVIH